MARAPAARVSTSRTRRTRTRRRRFYRAAAIEPVRRFLRHGDRPRRRSRACPGCPESSSAATAAARSGDVHDAARARIRLALGAPPPRRSTSSASGTFTRTTFDPTLCRRSRGGRRARRRLAQLCTGARRPGLDRQALGVLSALAAAGSAPRSCSRHSRSSGAAASGVSRSASTRKTRPAPSDCTSGRDAHALAKPRRLAEGAPWPAELVAATAADAPRSPSC